MKRSNYSDRPIRKIVKDRAGSIKLLERVWGVPSGLNIVAAPLWLRCLLGAVTLGLWVVVRIYMIRNHG